MYANKGAGQRLMAEFMAGQISVDQQNQSVKNPNNQDFFVTNTGRIMRYDSATDLYNVYNSKSKEFVPCDGLQRGETIVKHGTKEDLLNALIAQPGWGDWFCTKGYNFGAAAGKQILFGAATATVGAAVGPVIGRAANRAMDSMGYTATVAKPTLQEPAAQAVSTGVKAKAQGLNAIRGQVMQQKVGGIGHAAQGLRAANGRIIHNPTPRLPPCPNPIGPCVDPHHPFGPWAPWVDTMWPPIWVRGLATGGTTATGAVVGTFVAGPVGGIVGGALGAGFGSIFSA